ncbi:MAG: polyprenyl synthetase family protein [Betaproteobacteria bacterium]
MARYRQEAVDTLALIQEHLAEPLALMEERMRQVVLGGEESTRQLLAGSLRQGGKRIRPILVFLAGEATGLPAVEAVDVAAAAELIHTASLLHDDVVDRAATRRGQPTLHSVWGNRLAVLGGDFILAQALQLLLGTGDIQLLNSMIATVAAMGEGEILQIFHLFDVHTTEADYLDRIRRKTAVLMACSSEMGAQLAGAPPAVVQALRTYGMAVGMAFQVVDDLLDYVGDQAMVGKPVASDLLSGNLTLPVIHTLRVAEGELLRQWIEQRELTPKQVEHVVEVVRRNGSLTYAYGVAEGFVREAQAVLANLPATPARDWLDALATYLLGRES